MRTQEELLKRALELINDFCIKEYGHTSNDDDISDITLASTTILEDEIPIEVAADLKKAELKVYLEDRLVETFSYGSLESFIENELEYLEFDSLVYASDKALEKYRNYKQESVLYNGFEDYYGIYQLSEEGKKKEYEFMGMNYVTSNNIHISSEDYRLMYLDKITGPFDLEQLYIRFNINRPKDFKGHSLSVSDVVVTRQNGISQAFYVDSVGFVKLTKFVKEKQPFINHFYVVEDLEKRGILDVHKYDHIAEAIKKYQTLPKTQMKALGMQNNEDLPGSFDFVQCHEGKDIWISDWEKSPVWKNREIESAVAMLKWMIHPEMSLHKENVDVLMNDLEPERNSTQKGDVPDKSSLYKEAQEIASELDQLSQDIGLYEYRDNVENPESEITAMTQLILDGETENLIEGIRSCVEDCEDEELKERAEILIDKIEQCVQIEKDSRESKIHIK